MPVLSVSRPVRVFVFCSRQKIRAGFSLFFLFFYRKTICYVCAGNISSSRGMTADCDHITDAFKCCESSERGQHGGHCLAERRGQFDSGLGVEFARSPCGDALARLPGNPSSSICIECENKWSFSLNVLGDEMAR